MPTSVAINQVKAAFFKVSNTQTGAEIPAIFSNIVFKSLSTGVFGLNTDPAPNTMDLQITGTGLTVLQIAADCTFVSPINGETITRRKTTALPIGVTGSGAGFVVTIGN